MSWGGPPYDGHGYDPDATVLLPRAEQEPTVALPIVGGIAPPAGSGFTPVSAPDAPTSPLIGPPSGQTGPVSPAPPVDQAGFSPEVTAAGVPGQPDSAAQSVARNSAVMAAGSIVSRVTGFVRTAALGAALGGGIVFGDYNLANTLPNMVYELLLGGVLASVIVPLLVRAQTRDSDRGEAYTQRLLTLTTVFLAGATLLAVVCAPLIAGLFQTSGSSAGDQRLITIFSYLLLPEIFFYGMAALCAAILNTRGHFAAPMWTPILNNIVVTVAAGAFILLPTAGRELTPETISTAQILVIGVGTTLGIVVQATGLIPAMIRVRFQWKWRWDWRKLHLRGLARISSWMLGYVIISQIALVVVLRIAKVADNHGAPGPGIFNNGYLIFMMANGIVAVSIMTALMPRMSAAASEHRWEDLAGHLSLGTRLSAVVLVPATVAYVVLGRQLGVTLFSWHNYSITEGLQTGWIIAAAGVGLVPFAISQLQLFAFYAMPDTRTPALLNVPVVILRIGVDLLFLAVLPYLWLSAGLMLGNTVSYLFGAVVGFWLLRQRIGRLGLTAMLRTLGKLSLAALIAAVPTLLVSLILDNLLGTGKVGSLVTLCAGGLILVVVYLAAAVALKVREVNQVWTMVRGRLGR